ncbi:Hypothetical predicted protein [Octopus vulgaris]|uniref:Secreted peptide n=1 Tax=Octopus vulgaris TaxID=6645 RepID=A0AA36B0G5_OCTVU|nr:Hypothetical predicted protein [Octopus vulgaris]
MMLMVTLLAMVVGAMVFVVIEVAVAGNGSGTAVCGDVAGCGAVAAVATTAAGGSIDDCCCDNDPANGVVAMSVLVWR